MSKLVSIITPCYNGERFIRRYLDSIIDQTYRPLELFLIDDGSTDGTASIVQSYKDQLDSSNIILHYIHQENAGHAAALNRGLTLFQGDFLIWLDSDDFLFPDSIRRRVVFLEEHPKYGLVRSDGAVVNEKDPTRMLGYISKKRRNRFRTDIFTDLLLSRTFISNGSYMVRTSAFLDTHPTRKIYADGRGQNYQMLLPTTYKYKCGYIDEPMWAYVSRADSYGRSTAGISLDRDLLRIAIREDIVMSTLVEIPESNERYSSAVKLKYIRQRLALAYQYDNPSLIKKYYLQSKQLCPPTLWERLLFLSSQHAILYGALKLSRQFLSFLRRAWNRIKRINLHDTNLQKARL